MPQLQRWRRRWWTPRPSIPWGLWTRMWLSSSTCSVSHRGRPGRLPGGVAVPGPTRRASCSTSRARQRRWSGCRRPHHGQGLPAPARLHAVGRILHPAYPSMTQEDLDDVLQLQRERGDKLGKILVDLASIRRGQSLSALAEQLQPPILSIDAPPPSRPRARNALTAIPAPVSLLPRGPGTTTLSRWPWPIRCIRMLSRTSCTGLAVLPGIAIEQELLRCHRPLRRPEHPQRN